MACWELHEFHKNNRTIRCPYWEELLQYLPGGAHISKYDKGQVLEVDWPDEGITLTMNDAEVMFTQYNGRTITSAWDALWRDYPPRQMADRIKFYFR